MSPASATPQPPLRCLVCDDDETLLELIRRGTRGVEVIPELALAPLVTVLQAA